MKIELIGSEIKVDFKEPTLNELNEDGIETPLTDLAKTVIKTSMNGTQLSSEDVQASALTGGGDVSKTIIVPVIGKREADVTVEVVAVDTSGNVSLPVSETIRIDRVAPKPVE